MKRFITIIVLVVLILTISGVVFYVIYYGNIGKPKELNSADRYNPYYADAIQMKKPELCKKIKYALQSGPTDEIPCTTAWTQYRFVKARQPMGSLDVCVTETRS